MAFLDTLNALSLSKKLMAAGTVAAVLFAFSFLIRTASSPAMALLYSGVDDAAAGEVIARLDAEGVRYDVEGTRIFVEASARDRLRLNLARDGLPRQSVVGYELLEGMSGFSTTSEMFSAAYWRSKEGELARTLLSMPGVTAARVHIGADERSPFTRSQTPRTASVTITAPSGLTDAQVKAIQHVTALAVSNLQPERVVVADTRLGLLTSTQSDPQSSAIMDEESRAQNMEADLMRLIEARVGPGAARVSVSLDINRQRQEISEQIVDPNSAVATMRTRSESQENETGGDAPVTVASDLPDGDAAPNERATERIETREDIEYAVTRTARTTEMMPGDIERITVAVLLDYLPPAEEGEAPTPRTAEEIEALRTLIENAIGIDQARGDRVSIQTLSFEKPTIDEAAPLGTEGRFVGMSPNLWQMGQIGVVALVTLILGLFVVKPILTQQSTSAAAGAAGELGMTAADPVALLRLTSSEAPDEAAALLSAWLEEEEAA